MAATNLLKICSMNYLARLFTGFLFFFIPLYLADLGFNGLQIGFLMALIAVTSLLISLPVGIINDRLDIRYTILLGYLLSFTFFFTIGNFPNFWLFVPAFLIGGLGSTYWRHHTGAISSRTGSPGTRGGSSGSSPLQTISHTSRVPYWVWFSSP